MFSSLTLLLYCISLLLPSLLGVMDGEIGQYHGSHINACVRSPFSQRGPAREAGSFVIDFFFLSSFLSPPRLQITPTPLANTSGIVLDGRNRRGRKTEKKRAATPAAAETSVSLSGRSVPACPPPYLECADETIRCSRRVAACAGGEGQRQGGGREWVPRPKMSGDRVSRAAVDALLRASALVRYSRRRRRRVY